MLKYDKAQDGTPINLLKPGSERKVVLVCDTCGKESTTSFHNYYLAQKQPNRNGRTYCKKCATIASGVTKRGKSIRRTKPGASGDRHHSWKGGRRIGSDGYVLVYVSSRKHKKEHVLVMERHINRAIRNGEIVHHIDGCKLNNELSNLSLLGSESEHRKAHNSLYQLSCLLVKCGLISYNHKENVYVAVDKLRELLEHPEEGNQQPSLGGDPLEGSTTRHESQVDNNLPTSAEQEDDFPDDIV